MPVATASSALAVHLPVTAVNMYAILDLASCSMADTEHMTGAM